MIAEYFEKIGHRKLQAAHAEKERRIQREELWRRRVEFREVHQQSLTEMEELRKFQSSTFDTIARRAPCAATASIVCREVVDGKNAKSLYIRWRSRTAKGIP